VVIVGLGGALLALLAWTLFGGATTAPRPVAEGSVVPAAVAGAAQGRAAVTADAAPAPAPAAVPAVAPRRCAARADSSRAGAAAARPPAVATAEPGAPPVAVSIRHRPRRRRRHRASTPRPSARGRAPRLARIAINSSSYSGRRSESDGDDQRPDLP
jgi:hypothetical protein